MVQVIDTDGAFVPVAYVKQSKTGRTQYYETHIDAKDKNRLVRRNISKRSVVFHLARAQCVAGLPYEIYYFSRNMEHVLHDKSQELTDDEKEDLAYEIADQYSEHPEEFLIFLYNDDFHVDGNYKETWDFIMKNENSLKRYSNMSVFFERLGIY